MGKTEIAKIKYMDGVAVEESVRIFVACDLQTGNFNISRLFWLTEDGEWMYDDVESVIISICIVAKPHRTYFALGQDGLIFVVVSGGEDLKEKIKDAGTGREKYGYVTQIREIGGDVYVCGDQGQVYKRIPDGWKHIDQGMLHKERKKHDISHNSIDGTSSNDIYVVGDHGRIFHFNGNEWTDVSFPTNLHLQRVKCVSSDEVYICGEHGLLLRGNHRGWEMIGDPDMEETIWDVEMFKGKLYLAVEDRLMVYYGEEITPVDTKLTPEIDAHRLDARNGFLWSFGEEDLAYYDGSRWTRVIHPDNM